MKKKVQLTFDHFCINITFILNQLSWKEKDKQQGKYQKYPDLRFRLAKLPLIKLGMLIKDLKL